MKTILLQSKCQPARLCATLCAAALVISVSQAAEHVERKVTVIGGAGGGAVAIAGTPDGAKVEQRVTVVGSGGVGGAGGGAIAVAGVGGEPRVIEIRRVVGTEDGAGEGKEVAWLGVGTEEAPEALSAQLKLKGGQGLVVTYVGPDSPAAKAGLQKNDVLLELDGQMLVLPAQLRKLVQSRAEGDEVKLKILRSGQKQEVKATLGKTKAGVALLGEAGAWSGDFQDLGRHFRELRIGEQMGKEMKELHESLARAGINKDSIRVEVRKGIEEAQKAIEEALRSSTNRMRTHITADRVLKDLRDKGITIDKDASVTVQSSGRQVRTIVKTDDSGTFVLVADPKKRLTAHDKDGKLLFDGEIESEEQIEKVPASIRDQVKEMIYELGKVKPPKAEDEEEAGEESSITITPGRNI
jgi:membrane-associated protease RseP (regulator of RpoE activity)